MRCVSQARRCLVWCKRLSPQEVLPSIRWQQEFLYLVQLTERQIITRWQTPLSIMPGAISNVSRDVNTWLPIPNIREHPIHTAGNGSRALDVLLLFTPRARCSSPLLYRDEVRSFVQA